MHLVIDHPGQQELSTGVDQPGSRWQRNSGSNPGYAISLDQYVSILDAAFVDETGVLY
jgi:hypothetical protein